MKKKSNTYRIKYTEPVRSLEYVDDEMTGPKVIATEEIKRTIEVPVFEDYIDVKLPVKRRFNSGPFLTVFQNALLYVASDPTITKGEYRLLFLLLALVDCDNSVETDLSALDDILQVGKGNISRALSSLERRNILIKKRIRNRIPGSSLAIKIKSHQLNAHLAYHGKIKNHSLLKAEHPALVLSESELRREIEEKIHRAVERQYLSGDRHNRIHPDITDVYPEEYED